ncbi:MAG: ferrous iron transport protein A [Anaerolineae bacterium]|nr:ferrous iron transport protein A [Anaerolineae bacterium]
MMRCALCGYEFDETQMACHASCALNNHCTIVCCPNCGHQTVDESKSRLVKAFKWVFKRPDQPAAGDEPRRLSDLHPGQSALITAIESKNPSRMERLSIFGVTPGCEVTLVQRHPAYVLRVGFTELSCEREIADEILVEAV